MADTALTVPHSTADAPRLRDTWPVHKLQAGQLVGSYVVLTAVFTVIGMLITGPLADSAFVRADEDASQWFADRRTPLLDDLTWWGSMLADTYVKIVVTALAAGFMLWRWRRWREPLLVVAALVVEASAFITITTLVGRPRPAVARLESSPVDSSFPSGHTAAAVAYAAIAIVVFWHTRRVWVRLFTVFVTVAVPVIVGLSRTYRGMHHVSDVIAGALLGAAAVLLVWLILRRREHEVDAVGDTEWPAQERAPVSR
jgi:undecaprenyl-diphosphatase